MAFGPEILVEPTAERPIELRLGSIERTDLVDLPDALDDDVVRYLKPAFAAQLTDLAHGGEYFEEICDDPRNIHWGIFNHEGLIGITGFRDVGIGGPKHPVGRIALMCAAHLGRGFGGAALAASTVAFEAGLGFDHNVVETDVHNIATVRAHRNVGYAFITQLVRDGHLRHAMVQSRTGYGLHADPHIEAERVKRQTLGSYKIKVK